MALVADLRENGLDNLADELDVDPSDCVYLDDLGINLKPARDMGMTTIKVEDPSVAVMQLADVLGLDLGRI